LGKQGFWLKKSNTGWAIWNFQTHLVLHGYSDHTKGWLTPKFRVFNVIRCGDKATLSLAWGSRDFGLKNQTQVGPYGIVRLA